MPWAADLAIKKLTVAERSTVVSANVVQAIQLALQTRDDHDPIGHFHRAHLAFADRFGWTSVFKQGQIDGHEFLSYGAGKVVFRRAPVIRAGDAFQKLVCMRYCPTHGDFWQRLIGEGRESVARNL
jgi:hypothetical protein